MMLNSNRKNVAKIVAAASSSVFLTMPPTYQLNGVEVDFLAGENLRDALKSNICSPFKKIRTRLTKIITPLMKAGVALASNRFISAPFRCLRTGLGLPFRCVRFGLGLPVRCVRFGCCLPVRFAKWLLPKPSEKPVVDNAESTLLVDNAESTQIKVKSPNECDSEKPVQQGDNSSQECESIKLLRQYLESQRTLQPGDDEMKTGQTLPWLLGFLKLSGGDSEIAKLSPEDRKHHLQQFLWNPLFLGSLSQEDIQRTVLAAIKDSEECVLRPLIEHVRLNVKFPFVITKEMAELAKEQDPWLALKEGDTYDFLPLHICAAIREKAQTNDGTVPDHFPEILRLSKEFSSLPCDLQKYFLNWINKYFFKDVVSPQKEKLDKYIGYYF